MTPGRRSNVCARPSSSCRGVLGGARVDGFRLAQPPRVAPGLLVGALGPAMVELAATVADGVILTCLSPDDARSVVERYRGCGGSRVVASVPVCPSADADAVRDAIRPSLSMYLGIRAYANFHRSMGRAELLAPMFDAWARGDREAAVRALPGRGRRRPRRARHARRVPQTPRRVRARGRHRCRGAARARAR